MKRPLMHLLVSLALVAPSGCSNDGSVAPAQGPEVLGQDLIFLPIRPEAIALGNGSTFFAGSGCRDRHHEPRPDHPRGYSPPA